MKKQFLGLIAIAFLASCGGSDPKKDAQEVCDCMLKANQMPAEDPNRAAEQDKCQKLQVDKWNAYKDDIEKAGEFNVALSECSSEVLKKSMESYK